MRERRAPSLTRWHYRLSHTGGKGKSRATAKKRTTLTISRPRVRSVPRHVTPAPILILRLATQTVQALRADWIRYSRFVQETLEGEPNEKELDWSNTRAIPPEWLDVWVPILNRWMEHRHMDLHTAVEQAVTLGRYTTGKRGKIKRHHILKVMSYLDMHLPTHIYMKQLWPYFRITSTHDMRLFNEWFQKAQKWRKSHNALDPTLNPYLLDSATFTKRFFAHTVGRGRGGGLAQEKYTAALHEKIVRFIARQKSFVKMAVRLRELFYGTAKHRGVLANFLWVEHSMRGDVTDEWTMLLLESLMARHQFPTWIGTLSTEKDRSSTDTTPGLRHLSLVLPSTFLNALRIEHTAPPAFLGSSPFVGSFHFARLSNTRLIRDHLSLDQGAYRPTDYFKVHLDRLVKGDRENTAILSELTRSLIIFGPDKDKIDTSVFSNDPEKLPFVAAPTDRAGLAQMAKLDVPNGEDEDRLYEYLQLHDTSTPQYFKDVVHQVHVDGLLAPPLDFERLSSNYPNTGVSKESTERRHNTIVAEWNTARGRAVPDTVRTSAPVMRILDLPRQWQIWQVQHPFVRSEGDEKGNAAATASNTAADQRIEWKLLQHYVNPLFSTLELIDRDEDPEWEIRKDVSRDIDLAARTVKSTWPFVRPYLQAFIKANYAAWELWSNAKVTGPLWKSLSRIRDAVSALAEGRPAAARHLMQDQAVLLHILVADHESDSDSRDDEQ